jgi:hypothetical protein
VRGSKLKAQGKPEDFKRLKFMHKCRVSTTQEVAKGLWMAVLVALKSPLYLNVALSSLV